jgi:hypothetical protein
MPAIGLVNYKGIQHPVGYKLVTDDLKSLGLRENPNIIQYSIGEWMKLPPENIREGSDDWGGIWAARNFGSARKLRNYMKNKHGMETRIFKSALGSILYSNSYRIKTDSIILLEEL